MEQVHKSDQKTDAPAYKDLSLFRRAGKASAWHALGKYLAYNGIPEGQEQYDNRVALGYDHPESVQRGVEFHRQHQSPAEHDQQSVAQSETAHK